MARTSLPIDQVRSAVFGIETDINALTLKSSQTSALIAFPIALSSFQVSSSAKTEWLYTLRGRWEFSRRRAAFFTGQWIGDYTVDCLQRLVR